MEIHYKEILVTDAIKNETIYLYLKRNNFSENYLKNLRKEKGFILLNNTAVFINTKVKDGDVIKTNINPNTKSNITYCIIPLDIVYEDDNLLVVNKPSGLATMPSRSHYSLNLSGAIAYYMKDKDPNFVVRIINRLDKDTQGIIIVAKNSLMSNLLNNNNTKINKTYYALCDGIIKNDMIIDKNIDTIKNNLGFNQNKRITTDNKHGKVAKTYVHIKKTFNNKTLLKLNLENGRTHQIRVHLSSISHPLIGDSLYGKPSNLISHTALICKEISFVDPITNKKLLFKIDFPKDFLNVMEQD